MALTIKTIKKRSTFNLMREKGLFVKGESMNLQFLEDKELNKNTLVGYTATKKIGNAVKRNKAKRIMRELTKKIIEKHGKKNYNQFKKKYCYSKNSYSRCIKRGY